MNTFPLSTVTCNEQIVQPRAGERGWHKILFPASMVPNNEGLFLCGSFSQGQGVWLPSSTNFVDSARSRLSQE